jgi:phytoene desaturase
MSKSAVIIGAGLGGLATAIRLAYRGWTVRVLEQGSKPGGKMNRFERDGFTFDTGPSLITLPKVFERLFAIGDVDFHSRLRPVRLDPLFEYRFPNGDCLSYSSQLPDITTEIERITGSPDEVEGFYQFLNLGAQLFNLSERSFFERPLMTRPRYGDLPALLKAPKRWAWGSYQKAVNHHFSSPQLRQLFQRYPTYVGASPRHAVGTLALIPYMEIAEGGWYVPGGLYRIVEELCEIADNSDIKISTNTSVNELIIDNNRVTGVGTTTGEKIYADIVVSNADPISINRLTSGVAGIRLKDNQLSMSGFVMLIGLDRKLSGLGHHTVCFSDDYDREFSEIFDDQRFPDDPTVYVNVPTRSDPSQAPQGCESVFVMANTPAETTKWTQDFENEAIDRVRRRLVRSGMPDIFSDARFIETWTPTRFEREYAAPSGSIYGRVPHGWVGSFVRPPLKDRKVEGLYYVGGGTHPGGGTPTVLISAEIATNMIGDAD